MHSVLPLTPAHADQVGQFIRQKWGADYVVAHGRVFYPYDRPGFFASGDDALTGLAAYSIEGEACEIATLDSLRPNQGLGTALLEATTAVARAAGCRRVWLITTNDNLHALGFYQWRGFQLAALHREAVTRARAEAVYFPARPESDSAAWRARAWFMPRCRAMILVLTRP